MREGSSHSVSESVATSPLVGSGETSSSSSSSLTSLLATGRGLTVAGDSTSPVGEISVEEVWCGEKAGTAEVLRVLEHQEEVQVTDQDPAELLYSSTCVGNNSVESSLYKTELFYLQ